MSASDKLLIVGDSFSSDQTRQSWTTMLPYQQIDNLSSNGSSQYRILKKLLSIDLNCYDQIIIVHTSPYRIFVNGNLLHRHSPTHANCDLIYQDVKNSPSSEFRDHVVWWFENIFDLEQADLVYGLMVHKIIELCQNYKSAHITFFDEIDYPVIHNLNTTWKSCPGSINHLSPDGNKKVAEYVTNVLQ